MRIKQGVSYFSSLINSVLPELIGDKCVFLDVPYYDNIGDVLIWEGTEQLLKRNGIKCQYVASKDTYNRNLVPDGITILLQGGGNFGDLWVEHQNFRLQVVKNHPNNKIVILPQTVFYKSESSIDLDSTIFSRHKDLTICARDKMSENILKHRFSNRVILLPDMAFCIPYEKLKLDCQQCVQGSILFLKRDDVERANCDYSLDVPVTADVHDWPSYEKTTFIAGLHQQIIGRKNGLGRLHLTKLIDIFAQHFLKPHYIKQGVSFLSRYENIYTTRLHGAILSALLNKPFVFFDNSYGKNSNFYNTWFINIDDVQFIKCGDK